MDVTVHGLHGKITSNTLLDQMQVLANENNAYFSN
jgi:hypothetical protein